MNKCKIIVNKFLIIYNLLYENANIEGEIYD